MLVTLVIGCEIAFWLVLLFGLATRYLLHAPRTSTVILVAVPAIDLLLLGATVLHLHGGAVAGSGDGLAAAYLGASVAFGPSLVRRLDARFAYRFGGAPRPAGPPRFGRERARYEWREFGRAALAWAVSTVLLLGGVALAGGTQRGAALLGWIARITLVLLIWLIWPVTYTIWPARRRDH